MIFNKKGQVTPFIILGIVIVIVAVLLIFLISPRVSKPTITTTAQMDPIKDYVEECIKNVGEDALDLVGRNGGVIEVIGNPEKFLHYKDTQLYFGNNPEEKYDVKLWCSTIYYEPCARKFFEYEVEDEIINYIDTNIDSCLYGIEEFPNTNYNINKKNINIAIGKYNTIIILDLPVVFEKGGEELQRFSYTFNNPLGRFLEVADEIIDRGEAVMQLGDVPLDYLTEDEGPFSDLSTIIHWAEDDGEIYILQLKDNFADTNYKFQFAVKGWVT